MALLYRCYHFILKCIVILIGVPNPKLHRGSNALLEALQALKLKQQSHVLVVTDNTLVKLPQISALLDIIKQQQLEPFVFSDVHPNPTVNDVEQGYDCYTHNQCGAIIAIGGGSVIDCAKLIGAKVVRPNKPIADFKGLFKVLKRLPPNIAIPTTAGTGAETTVAAVVNDPQKQQKYAATDFSLVPQHAVLLPNLTTSLPAQLTATTAIDALTHAIEALLSINCLRFSRERALQACDLIFSHLPNAYQNGEDLDAREQLLLASFYAGQAFTRTSVGYVHAISHQLSANYGTAHGLSNAVLLLPVLRWYGTRIDNTLALIARECRLTSLDYPIARQAEDLLTHIEQLLTTMHIQTTFSELRGQDIDALAQSALKEAHPDYPVPHFMNLQECRGILTSVSTTA
ncbi:MULTISPECIES: iron-containing alcohol dehydrogenase [Pseudoalteromonas]|uniref:Alcohol dehydrogenase n=1 Tax=Pseudoalteromonas amylolytica TaxID=1859457 RepID=A0A1S1MUQ9_9GAMM|nr:MULTISPECIES: iron-containing alcohol dehydrogenase [Pseudoalteromonas]MCF6436298.1 iron-containing alcohol dehydrogenase [Pseudoalteromonas sp. MMG022]OHU86777.1 alcohol dehydrogenase [Pseudoalteromonas sp. JW3]OHU88698.1 alcohol dehydrogenase [Pseudoalteromonas amylolytica]